MRVQIKRGLQIAGLVLLVVAAFAYRGARAQAQTGAGYIAHQLCSCIFVAERSLESCRPDMLPVMDRIQAEIIDVDGRQCTDFECFSARKLDKGIEHALDVTTTRTLMGHAYPMPGLHAKYYDQEMLPLVEVVQDTCGRHDAFALAC